MQKRCTLFGFTILFAITFGVVEFCGDSTHAFPTATSETVIVTWGPFVLPAATESGPCNLHINTSELEQPCSNAFITSLVPDLINLDGTSANFDTKTMMHHFVLYNSQRADLTCPREVLCIGK